MSSGSVARAMIAVVLVSSARSVYRVEVVTIAAGTPRLTGERRDSPHCRGKAARVVSRTVGVRRRRRPTGCGGGAVSWSAVLVEASSPVVLGFSPQRLANEGGRGTGGDGAAALYRGFQ